MLENKLGPNMTLSLRTGPSLHYMVLTMGDLDLLKSFHPVGGGGPIDLIPPNTVS